MRNVLYFFALMTAGTFLACDPQPTAGTDQNVARFADIHEPGRRVTLIRSVKNTVTADARTMNLKHNGVTVKGLQPGDTVEMSGHYLYVQLRNIPGTEARPIIFINRGGQVTAGGVSAYTFILLGNHFKLLGNGTPGVPYGFKIGARDTSTTILQLGNSSGVEVANVEFYGGAIGLQQNKDSGQVMVNNFYHHNWFHNLGNKTRSGGRSEAFYLGYTNGPSNAAQVNCRIENNLIENVTGDGIQVNLGSYVIKNNVLRNYATAALASQRSGMVIGGGVKAVVSGNIFEDATGKPMEIFSDTVLVTGNIFRNIDMRSNTSEDLIYINSKLVAAPKKMFVDFNNNTFDSTTPNRKFVLIQAGGTFGAARFVNNRGLRREDIAGPSSLFFSAWTPADGRTVKKTWTLYTDQTLDVKEY